MKTLLRFSALAILLITFTSSLGWGQTAKGDYVTISSGNWNSLSTWGEYDGSTISPAISLPDANTRAIFIYHSVSINDNSNIVVKILQVENDGLDRFGELIVPNTASLQLNDISNITTDASLQINGTLIRNNGSLTVSGSINYGSASTLKYIGSSKLIGNEFPSTSGPKNLIIELDNTYDYVNIGSNTRTVTGTLTLTKGTLSSSSSEGLVLGSSSETGTLVFTSNSVILGYFTRYVTTSMNNVYFPVGIRTAGVSVSQRKVEISTSFSGTGANSGTIKVKYFNSDPTAGTTPEPSTDNGASVNTYWNQGYWEIASGNGLNVGLTGSYTVILNADGITTGVTNWDKLRVMKKSNLTDSWGYLDGLIRKLHGTYETGGTSGNKYAKRSGLSTFSYFGIGGASSEGNELQGSNPVTLSSFSYGVFENRIDLAWVTSAEENNSGFDIERKKENESWNKIGFVDGKGTTNTQNTYKFSDKNLKTGNYEYRLKQIDYNGNYEYYDLQSIVEISVPNKYNLNQNYPNPFNPVTKIDFEVPENGMVSIKIYDMLGKEVKTLVNEMKQAGYHTVELNAGNLSSGTYFYRMNAGKFVKTLKMVVVK